MTPSSEQGPLRHLVRAYSDIARGMDRDAILAELLEIQGMLLDARLSDEDRHALHGAAQALRHVPGRGGVACHSTRREGLALLGTWDGPLREGSWPSFLPRSGRQASPHAMALG